MVHKLEGEMPSEKSLLKVRQRLARAIEDSYPRELSRLVDAIAFGWEDAHKHVIQSRLLKFAKENYDAAKPEIK